MTLVIYDIQNLRDMLSAHDLMYHPDDVQPLGSRKGVVNKPTDLPVDLTKMFLASANLTNLYISLLAIYRQNGGTAAKKLFLEFIILLQKKFVRDNSLDDYVTADVQATGISDYTEALTAINNDFHRAVYKYFDWEDANPYRDLIEVGPADWRETKKAADIMPDDFGTLDLWRAQSTQVLSNRFRDNNRIPVYRSSIHMRHYDRSNEGLRDNNPDRASLETPIYGYDMSQVAAGCCNYKADEWFGFT